MDAQTVAPLPRAGSARSVPDLRSALLDDASSRMYRFVYRPLLVLQLALYAHAVWRWLQDPSFPPAGVAGDPMLTENHIGNYSIMASQPNPSLLAVHLGMATFWIAAVLFQKRSVAAMARALAPGPGGRPVDARAFRAERRRHAVLGSILCVVALSGTIAGPIIAYQSHGHPAMRTFLLVLPLYFLPAITTVWVMARRKERSIRDHQAWADTAFLGPAVASLWAEALIWLCGRHTPLGPRYGELVGTGLAWALILAILVVPTWRARGRALASGAPG